MNLWDLSDSKLKLAAKMILKENKNYPEKRFDIGFLISQRKYLEAEIEHLRKCILASEMPGVISGDD